MIVCLSVSAVWVVSTLIGGGDTQILTAVTKFDWSFCTQEIVGILKHCSHALALSCALLCPCTLILSHPNKPPSETFIVIFSSQGLISVDIFFKCWKLSETSTNDKNLNFFCGWKSELGGMGVGEGGLSLLSPVWFSLWRPTNNYCPWDYWNN